MISNRHCRNSLLGSSARPWLVLGMAALFGCGNRQVPPPTDQQVSGADIIKTLDVAASQDLGDPFCAGSSRVELNGSSVKVEAVGGDGHPQTSCCNEVGLVHFRLPRQNGITPFLQLTMLVYYGTTMTTPVTVDLANLPPGWGMMLEYYRCKQPDTIPCARAAGLVDTLQVPGKDSFKGSLTVTGTGKGRKVTLCLTAAAEPKTHHFMQRVRLFARDVPIPKTF